MDKVTVVTVVYNDVYDIENTILSVINQTYKNIEYIIVDGNSNDGTLDIVHKYTKNIDILISEPDKGIYDAMNKAIDNATGEWIIFMNSGDGFANVDVLNEIFNNVQDLSQYDFFYSNAYIKKKYYNVLLETSFEKGILLHQSIIYRKNLHNIHGKYIVSKKYIISDYLFFLRINYNRVKKVDTVISINQKAGVSSGLWCACQCQCCNYIFNRITIGVLFYRLIISILKYYLKIIIGYKKWMI
jgi:glycosyltransferase involved in cell wall biosynthesis